MTQAPTISIVIPVYNGGQKFRRCLESIHQLNPQPGQLIVVADGDTDGSRDVAAEHGAHVITTASPGGPARARNIGAEAAEGDILFFVDADVTVHQDAIEILQRIFSEEADTAAVFGSYDDSPSEPNFTSQFKNLMHHYVHQVSKEEATTFWGACGAIRRDVFFEVGGFDAERYGRPCIEDIELGYRLTDAGYRIRLCRSLHVKHLKKWTVVSQIKTDVMDRALPWTKLMLERSDVSSDLNLQWSSRVSTFLVALLLLLVLVTFIYPIAAVVILAAVIGLVYLNAPLYRFFYEKRGLFFSLRAILWHWVYYLYSGVAFGVGSFQHTISNLSKQNT